MAKLVLAFDIYGTLLDTNSIARSISNHLQLDDDQAANVSALWRRYQLEYTWRLNSMDLYEPFDTVTRKSLLHALRDSGVEFTKEHIENLMKAYNILPCFSDTVQALEKLRSLETARVVVFSNGK
ncbi:hypothetical protein M0805_002628 [Coniferiporia weirii]|nr:hypothetical protein M0805_002628 [Coniferiporia weirii]